MKTRKKLLSLVLAAIMVLGMLPVGAFASEPETVADMYMGEEFAPGASGFYSDGMYYTGKADFIPSQAAVTAPVVPVPSPTPGEGDNATSEGDETVDGEWTCEAYPWYQITLTDGESGSSPYYFVPELSNNWDEAEGWGEVFVSPADNYDAQSLKVTLDSYNAVMRSLQQRTVGPQRGGELDVELVTYNNRTSKLPEATDDLISSLDGLEDILNSFAVVTSGDFTVTEGGTTHQPGPFAVGGTATLGSVNVGTGDSYGLGSYFGGPLFFLTGEQSEGNQFGGSGKFIHVNEDENITQSYSGGLWTYTPTGGDVTSLNAKVPIYSEAFEVGAFEALVSSATIPAGDDTIELKNGILTVQAGSHITLDSLSGISVINITDTSTKPITTTATSITVNSKEVVFAQDGAPIIKYNNNMYASNQSGLTEMDGFYSESLGLIWNFLNAETINIGNWSDFMGHILAPNADVTNKANVDGTVVAKSLTTSAEIHLWGYRPEDPAEKTYQLGFYKDIFGGEFSSDKWLFRGYENKEETFEFQLISAWDNGETYNETQKVTFKFDENGCVAPQTKQLIQFQDMPAPPAGGEYTLKEINIPAGWTPERSSLGTGVYGVALHENGDASISAGRNTGLKTLRNTYNSKTKPTLYELNIEKALEGVTADEFTKNYPDFKITIKGDEKTGNYQKELTLEDGNLSWELNNLPAGTYTITESGHTDAKGWTFEAAKVDGGQLNNDGSITVTLDGETTEENVKLVTITNVYKKEPPLELTISKKFVFGGTNDSFTGEERAAIMAGLVITVTDGKGTTLAKLTTTGNGSEDCAEGVRVEHTWDANTGEATWTLSIPSSYGDMAAFKVTENWDATGKLAQKYGWDGKYKDSSGTEVSVTDSLSPIVDELSIKNSYSHLMGELVINKTVTGRTNLEGTYTFTVKGDNGVEETVTITTDENGKGQSSTLTLPYGKYTVTESVQGGTSPYTLTTTYQVGEVETFNVTISDTPATMDVTNEYKYVPNHVNISINKVWEDGNDRDGLRPDSIRFQLFHNGQPIEGEHRDVTPAEAENGVSFTYDSRKYTGTVTIKEVGYSTLEDGYVKGNIPGYDDPAYAEDGSTVTNCHEPAVVTIPVEKVWTGNYTTLPDSVEVTLLADGTPVDGLDPLVLNASNEWKGTFQSTDSVKLYKNDGGQPIVYTVQETKIGNNVVVENAQGNWTVSYSGDESGFTVTNEYDEPTSPPPPPPEDDDDPTPTPVPSPPVEEFEIPENDAPLAPQPPATPEEEEVIILEEHIPLGNLPQTGTTADQADPTRTMGMVALAMSLAAAGLAVTIGRKKEDVE